MPDTWRDRYDVAREKLASDVEARRLVEQASGYEGAEFHVGLEQKVTDRTGPYFDQMLERRLTGEPLQYVLGRWGFRTLDLFVDRRVLIPRPETEQVVELALDEMRRLGKRHPVCADLGTGSGAIAISLAVEGRAAEVWATDASADALDVARANLTGAGTLIATRVQMAVGSWFTALPATHRNRFDLIVSNPPYIAEAEMADVPDEVSGWEPRSALVPGPTGLEAVEHLIARAPEWLTDDGVLVLEMAPHQTAAARDLAARAGYASVEVHADLSGRDRALIARRS